jgi:hypothetical protein
LERCNVLIIDEREIVDKDIIDKIFIPFLTATRTPPFLRKKEYEHLYEKETNHFIELSSIGSKTSSLYKEFENYLKYMEQGIDEYFVFSIPYQIPYSSRVINKKILQKMVRENTTGAEAFRQEMEVIPTGDSDSSMFSFDKLNQSRKIHVPILPITDEEYLDVRGDIRKAPHYKRKQPGELRILSMDVAMMGSTVGSSDNDLSVFTLFVLTKDGEKYSKEIPYIETMDGTNIEPQVLRFKQLYYDLECDYCVLDCGGVGQTIYDLCTKKTDDPIRGKKYPAWKSMNNLEKMESRVIDETAIPVIYAVKIAGASAQSVHANIVTRARLAYERNEIKLLVSEDVISETISSRYKQLIKNMNEEEYMNFLIRVTKPFIETTMLIQESIETRVVKRAGGISINEKSRKDRLMSKLYGLFYIDTLEQELLEEPEDDDEECVYY